MTKSKWHFTLLLLKLNENLLAKWTLFRTKNSHTHLTWLLVPNYQLIGYATFEVISLFLKGLIIQLNLRLQDWSSNQFFIFFFHSSTNLCILMCKYTKNAMFLMNKLKSDLLSDLLLQLNFCFSFRHPPIQFIFQLKKGNSQSSRAQKAVPSLCSGNNSMFMAALIIILRMYQFVWSKVTVSSGSERGSMPAIAVKWKESFHSD